MIHASNKPADDTANNKSHNENTNRQCKYGRFLHNGYLNLVAAGMS